MKTVDEIMARIAGLAMFANSPKLGDEIVSIRSDIEAALKEREGESFDEARSSGVFKAALPCCTTWYATELRKEGWDAALRTAPPKAQPIDHVGDSAFEAWFSEYDMANKGTKQQMRDAYAAGITDAERHHKIGD